MLSKFPVEAILFHACVRTDDGITIFNARVPRISRSSTCSSRPGVPRTLEAVGLPEPTVAEIGIVHAARARSELVTVS